MKIGYVSISNWNWWKYTWKTQRFGLFLNKDGIKPGRWGFYILGFEFGSRNPGDRVGVFLKNSGLWPW